jgi:hypothetical protein
MKKLSLFAASVSTALVCAAVPASFNWSPAKFSLDTAEARVGRPLTATSVAGVSRRVHRREYRRAAAGAAVGAAVVGGAAAGAYVGGPAPAYGPGPAVAAAPPVWRAGLWLRPRALPGLCDREPCHGKMVQDRIERLSILLDAIAATETRRLVRS